ncbi:MAG: AAA family ATPase [Euryarchaeota archaeon]|nr:AAA family ATPase [Euryarchaeota archaeon]
MVERIKTYIEGFDEKLEGGIPMGHVVLICGTPGTMKSSTAFGILYNNAKQAGMKGMYITLEEGYDNLRGAMADLGMGDIEDLDLFLVDVGKIRMEHKEEEYGKNWLDILTKYISSRIENDGFDLVAIDSMAALYALASLKNPRIELFHFMRRLKELGATIFLISEVPHGSDALVHHDEDYLADAIFHLKLHEVGETDVQLRIRCLKMRRTRHSLGWMRLIMKDGKFVVTPAISE